MFDLFICAYKTYCYLKGSSGKIGPFVGDVFQDLSAGNIKAVNKNTVGLDYGEIKNILKVGFPKIEGIYYTSASTIINLHKDL